MNDSLKRFKSCQSNLKNGNISHFSLPYLKKNRQNKIIVIEKEEFTKNGFCVNSLGNMETIVPDYDFIFNRTTTSIIKKTGDKYYLHTKYLVDDPVENDRVESLKQFILHIDGIIEDIEDEENKEFMEEYLRAMPNYIEEYDKLIDDFKKDLDKERNEIYEKCYVKPIKKIPRNNRENDMIILDPGIRTFLTGYSNNKCVKIGTNLYDTVQRDLKRIDKINSNISTNEDLTTKKETKIKKRIEKIRTKIRNRINELHWKVIRYLVSNYKNIIIGSLSTKKIGENELPSMVKRVGNAMRLYEFKERLKYKSKYNGGTYKETNEAYTSKVCNKCGNYKNDLGGNKMYECEKCGMVIDRDINGSINIALLSL
jgi:IS605 OrfB family transposase